MFQLIKNPMTRRRILRFKEMKRAHVSFWLLMALYVVSLGSEFICNNTPLYIRLNGKSYFPVFQFYPEDEYLGNGKQTRPDYKELLSNPVFTSRPDHLMVFPPIPFGPFESIDPGDIEVSDQVTVTFRPMPHVATVNVRPNFSIAKSRSLGAFFVGDDAALRGRKLTDYVEISDTFRQAVENRFRNLESPFVSERIERAARPPVMISLATFAQRERPPSTVRITFREIGIETSGIRKIQFDKRLKPLQPAGDFWENLSESSREMIRHSVHRRFEGPMDSVRQKIGNRVFQIDYYMQEVRFPYPPVKGHLFGIDSAGRDVLARILYGLRTSLSFGLMLVVASMILGIAAGAVQGYYGGVIDISAQRLIEIWSALPFLYIMILMGSIYGRSFSLLLVCYGIFNWIGISYYIRAEFLRLRKQAFVESARCMGLSSRKIIFRHILPNALVPVITFFPFLLVGAIGSLAALDYLGFGLPPPTPSWGELLFQAQQYRWAWWLILYPSLALFTVMLLGVFIGEGIRNAYDPRQYSRME